MSDKVYDIIKAILTVWLFPIVTIVSGMGVFLATLGYANAEHYCVALAAFLGVLGVAFGVSVKNAKTKYYEMDYDPSIERMQGYPEEGEEK